MSNGLMLWFLRLYRFAAVLLLICMPTIKVSATHMYGADLFYTHISGNTYQVSMYIYGDCAGQAFPSYPGAPEVRVYNGNSLYTTITLAVQAPTNGLEVTPICPSQAGNTKCSSPSYPLPGVKRFYYTKNVTLNTSSANWKFQFTGNMGSSTQLGRTAQMTNIFNNTGNSIMVLEATLNNTNGPNSSPVFTTIPTPFYCINKPAQYNPGTTNSDGDSLVYSLVPGIQPGNTNVSYRTAQGYSATSPLATATNAFTFSTVNGQLNFTPNVIQQSLVVTRVDEYKNGILVGTAMREMTIVVYNCNNNPPGGLLSNNNIGSLDSVNSVIKVCKSTGTLTFNINPTDLDTHKITMSVSGLPSGASVSISNNNSTAPTAAFTWLLNTMPLGEYTFTVTFVDDGCPISSKQTSIYKIDVLPDPGVTFNTISKATCTQKEVFTMTPSVTPSPWRLDVKQGSAIIDSFLNVTSAQTDSLSPGSYTVRVTNANGCYSDSSLVIDPPPAIIPGITVVPALCNGDSTGMAVVSAGGGKPSFVYALGTGNFSSADTFSNLPAGTYTFKIKDQNDCLEDTTVTITEPSVLIPAVTIDRPDCAALNNGKLFVNGSGGTPTYTYAIDTGSYASTNTFTNLAAGTYVLHVKDDNSCEADTTVTIQDSLNVSATVSITDALCKDSSSGTATISASGGVSPYTFAVNAGSFGTNNTFTGLAAGSYTFYVTDDLGCEYDSAFTITEPSVLIPAVTIDRPDCAALNNGKLFVNGSGGTPTYTYAIDTGSYASTNTFTNLAAGTYVLHVKDDNSCEADTTVTIQDSLNVSATVSITDALCKDSSSGTATISASGGVSPYTFAVNAGSFGTNNTFTGLAAGSYTFYVTDDLGCEYDSAFTITEPTGISIMVTAIEPLCNGDSTGSISVNGSGGTPAYTYAMNSGGYTVNSSFANLSAGNYIFKIKDQNDCIIDTSLSLTEPTKVLVDSVINDDPLCFNGQDGEITFTGTGGLLPYTYAMGTSGFVSGNTFSNLTAGSYTIYIKDANGCTNDSAAVLSQPTDIIPVVTATPPLCSSDSTGIAKINATGGTPSYTYAINTSTFSSSNTFSNIPAGIYTLRVKDNNNCIKDTSVTIIDPAALRFDSVLSAGLLCYGDQNGLITAYGGGGRYPYTYAINSEPFSANNTFSGLAGGSYTITIKDSLSCLHDTFVTVAEPTPIVPAVVITPPLCNGGSTGSTMLSGSGGVPGYTFAMNSGTYSSANTFGGLTAGSYIFKLKDQNGCVEDTSVNITEPAVLQFDSLLATEPLCNSDQNGQIKISGSGGTPSITYAIGAGAYGNNNTFSSLSAGTYQLHIKDNNGCTADSAYQLQEPTPVVLLASADQPDCETLNNGVITLNGNGGTPNYTYAIGTTPHSTNKVFSSLSAGTYTLHVKDNNGCTEDTTITIADSLDVLATLSVTDALCFDSSSGNITVTAAGGATPYRYAINTGSFGGSNIFNNLPAGTYTVYVKDTLGCETDTNISITEPTPVTLAATVTDPSCNGSDDGSVLFVPAGGTPWYKTAMNGGTFTANNFYNKLKAGANAFTVVDSNGCERDTVINLKDADALKVDVVIEDVKCFGDDNGKVDITALGGTPGYLYAVDSSSFNSGATISQLTPGQHTIRIKDSKGCSKDSLIEIGEPSELLLDSVAVTDATCHNYKDGALQVYSSGGTPLYIYSVNNEGFNNSDLFDKLGAGTHILQVKDANDCLVDTTVTIEDLPPIETSIVEEDATCYGYSNGAVEVEAAGGVPPFMYTIGADSTISSGYFKGLKVGEYTITVFDKLGCSDEVDAFINSPDKIEITMDVMPNNCDKQENTGIIEASVRGGTGPYLYAWNLYDYSDASQTNRIINLKEGIYQVNVTDAADCIDSNRAEMKYDVCCRIFIPTVFSPNGDGLNDKIRILHDGEFELKVFSIYSRFGERVFTTSNKEDGWDGVWQDRPQDIATYNYFMIGKCGQDDVMKKGTITLVR